MFTFFVHNICGDYMRNTKYDKFADNYKAKENKILNCISAFIGGGMLGLFGEGLIEIFIYFFHFSRTISSTLMIVLFIFIGSLLTALGIFDKMVTIFKCGLLIPITGFANSMTSCCLDYKREGPIYGIGSNIFHLAGSVIVYGVMSAWIFSMIRYLIGGIS